MTLKGGLMNRIRRDYFGNVRETKISPEHHLAFVKTMLSYTINTDLMPVDGKKNRKNIEPYTRQT
jgi:hypothetical protein